MHTKANLMSVLGGRRLGCRRGPRSLVHSSQEQAAILAAKGKTLELPDAKAPFLMSTAASYSHTRMHSRTEHNKKRVPCSDDRFESRRHGCTPCQLPAQVCRPAASSLIHPETPGLDYSKMAAETCYCSAPDERQATRAWWHGAGKAANTSFRQMNSRWWC